MVFKASSQVKHLTRSGWEGCRVAHRNGGWASMPRLLDVQLALSGLQHICCGVHRTLARWKWSIKVVRDGLVLRRWLRYMGRQTGREHLAVPLQGSCLTQNFIF